MVLVQNKVDLLQKAEINRYNFIFILILYKDKILEFISDENMRIVFNSFLNSREEAEALACALGVRFYRICVKQNFYVDDG